MTHRFQFTAHGSVFMFIYLLYVVTSAEIEQQRSTYRPIHVVVARFREPIGHLAWLSKFPHTIYSRGGGEISPMSSASPLHIVERLENVGREAFIFLDHIVKHFDHLAEVNVFTQAVQNVRTLYTEEDFQSDVQKLAQSAKNRSTLLSEENDGFVFLVPWCESSLHPVHMKNLRREFGEEKCKIFTEGYRTLLNFTVENPRFSGTSCFAVTRQVSPFLSILLTP